MVMAGIKNIMINVNHLFNWPSVPRFELKNSSGQKAAILVRRTNKHRNT
jgi:hypothetical protein